MNPCGLLVSGVAISAISLLCLCYSLSAGDSPMPPKKAVLERIHELTGLDKLFAVGSIEKARASEANIRFMEGQLEGEAAIKVTFKRGKSILTTARAGEQDRYNDRQFVVLLDANAKRLLSVTSTISKKDPEIDPEKPLNEIEKELANESYAFPRGDPSTSFIEALEVIGTHGLSHPYSAKEIEGFCVVHSHSGTAVPRLEWIISLRGMPPVSPALVGPPPLTAEEERAIPDLASYYKPSPVWERNHMRHFIDATGGVWTGPTNFP